MHVSVDLDVLSVDFPQCARQYSRLGHRPRLPAYSDPLSAHNAANATWKHIQSKLHCIHSIHHHRLNWSRFPSCIGDAVKCLSPPLLLTKVMEWTPLVSALLRLNLEQLCNAELLI